MSVPEGKKTPGFLAAVLKRTGAPRKLKARGKSKKKRYDWVGNGAPSGDESGIGGGPGGGAAGGGS